MNDEIKEMTNEEYMEFLNTIDTLPIKEQEIIRRGVLQINDDKKELLKCISDLQQENERLKQEIDDYKRISQFDGERIVEYERMRKLAIKSLHPGFQKIMLEILGDISDKKENI